MPEVADQDLPLEYLKVGKVKKEGALEKALDKAVKTARKGKAAKQPITIKASPTTAQFTSTGKKKPPIEQIDLSQVKKIQRSSLNGKVVVAALNDDKKTPYRLVSMRFKSAEAYEKGIKALRPEKTSPAVDRSASPSPVRGAHLDQGPSPPSNIKEQTRPVSPQTSPGRSLRNRYDTPVGNDRETPHRARVTSVSSATLSTVPSSSHKAYPVSENYRRPDSTKSLHNNNYSRWLSGVNMCHAKTTYASTDFIFRPRIETPTEEVQPPVRRNYVVTYIASHPTPCPQLAYTPNSMLTSTPDVPLSLSEQSHAEQSPVGNGFNFGSSSYPYTDRQATQHSQRQRQFILDNNNSHNKWLAENCGSRQRSEDIPNHFGGADPRKRYRQVALDRASCLSIRTPRATSTNSSNYSQDEPRGACRIRYPSRAPVTNIRRSRSHSGRSSIHRIELVGEDLDGESMDDSDQTCKSEGQKSRKSSGRRWIKQPTSSSCSACGSSVWQFRPRSGSCVSASTGTTMSMDSYEYMEADCPKGIIKLYYRPTLSAF
ncbi:hypothetical protein SprV_0100195600 [Sparganum proliferum]